MELKQFITMLADNLEMDPPEPDETGEYVFTFDDDLSVTCLSNDNETIVLYQSLGKVPDDFEEYLKKILKINLARIREQKEVLSMNPEKEEIQLHRRISMKNLELDEFEQAMEDFVNSLEYWRNRINEIGGETASPFRGLYP